MDAWKLISLDVVWLDFSESDWGGYQIYWEETEEEEAEGVGQY
jgi:hypothetical protein